MHGGRQVDAACFRATRNKNEAYENMPVVRCKPHSCSFPLFFCSLVCTVSVNNNDTDFIFQPDVLIRLEGNRVRCFCCDTKFLELLESVRLCEQKRNKCEGLNKKYRLRRIIL